MVHINFWFMLILGGNVHTAEKNTETLIVASKEMGLEVNSDKTKYTVMSRGQNAGQSHSIKTDDSCFERVEQFIYLGTTLTNQNYIQKEIKSGSMSGNACYRSVQSVSFSRLLSRKYKDQDIQNHNFAYRFV
jgi:hypothetical protein